MCMILLVQEGRILLTYHVPSPLLCRNHTGEYVIKVPEWIISEFGWYEGTEINMEVDGDAIVVTEL